ncbi:uncharacterized protein PV07_07486 [Cladophialophora immunda]|uniref:C3H1-type domain-containing protein n=1 Tax=Cladophialophora immunda TaxID=569365 RepID=A0A0D2C9J7_9EURO|nr:uncharacterized protein PV07_07486 [Cladophialophora immunda]KIW27778.1 hypothetical protein PV07_07486 [Cladophialophora immunda]
MAEQQSLRPQFFVTRQNGAMVPLIAMDELPIHVQIEGVSRSLSAFDVAGMTGVGVYEARHEYHVVQSMNNTTPIPFNPICAPPSPASNASKPDSTVTAPVLRPTTPSTPTVSKAPDAAGDQPSETASNAVPSSTGSNEEESKSSRPTTPPASPSATIQPCTTTATATATTTATAATTTTSPPLAWRIKATAIPAGNSPPADLDPDMPPVGQKVYCSYWLRTGECNFAQQGCMFKHVMPMKLGVLEVLGFRDLPDWYRKAYKVGSLRVNGGRNGLSYGIFDGSKAAPPPPPPPPPHSHHQHKRVSLNAEATRRMIATHINALPVGNGRGGRYYHADRAPRAGGNHRGPGFAHARPTASEVDRARAAERERRDERLAAAFAADMDSELGDMMDAQMEKIREQEQAGWEEEQNAAREAAAKKGESGESGESSEEGEKKTAAADVAGDAGASAVVGNAKKQGRGGKNPRRKKAQGQTQKKA